ncbi:MAG: DUF4159 domain-containing protein [Hyphomicrobiaceae bacterium]
MSIGPLAFLSPWLLTALVALPLIWWLLRAVPPRPRRIAFPPTRILVGLESKEQTPVKTPWWLTLIRLLAAGLIILALANPVLNPDRGQTLKGGGPLVLVVDNGWASAHSWAQRIRASESVLAQAAAVGRPVIVVPTAPPTRSVTLRLEAPAKARTSLAALLPQPFAPRRAEALKRITEVLRGQKDAGIVWVSDGIDHDLEGKAFAEGLAALAAAGGRYSVYLPGADDHALALRAEPGTRGKLEATIIRAEGSTREGLVHAYSARGQRLAESRFKLAPSETAAKATFEMPLEIRNQVARLEIAGERSAGAVHLLDERSRWPRVGLIGGTSREQAQPLLAPLYYIERALTPFAELLVPNEANVVNALGLAIRQNASVIVMADIGTLVDEPRKQLEEWVKKGGVLVRFAGPRLEKGSDELMPVPLRLGGRTLGGALSWSTPQPLAPFDEQSLFAGLTAPADVLINRQVLADPAQLGPETKIWARLKDGTPLVTAARNGEGTLVLFHVTANSDWSNLPLSGLFVEMLQRIITLGRVGGAAEQGTTQTGGEIKIAASVLSPFQSLDGFGILKAPPATAQAIALAKLAETRPSLEHPPGYWGSPAAPRALNIAGPKLTLRSLAGTLPGGAERLAYESERAMPLKPSLLMAGLALVFADVIAIILLQLGSARMLGARRAASAIAGLALLGIGAGALTPGAAHAQAKAEDPLAMRATAKATFAYVLTGDQETDRISRLGLEGLRRVLTARTAVEPAEAVAVNVATSELAFYPILYWPVLFNAEPLPEAVAAKIDAYMKQGGMIIFDTRDQGQALPTARGMRGPGATALQRLLSRLDIPRLEQVPEGHVLTKSFYLLRSFPGRYEGGPLWVEAELETGDGRSGRQARKSDGVSSILITSNDLAAAWALDETNRPLLPVSPGSPRQREMAFRVGVNIVMYALTGNYKADQVHVPALLQRLGQ